MKTRYEALKRKPRQYTLPDLRKRAKQFLLQYPETLQNFLSTERELHSIALGNFLKHLKDME